MASNEGNSRAPEEIQRDIERTREDLASTLDALVDRVSPKKVAERSKERVRGAVNERLQSVNDKAHGLANRHGGSHAQGAALRHGGSHPQTPQQQRADAAEEDRGPTVGDASEIRTQVRTDRVAMAVGAVVVVLVTVVVVTRRRRKRRRTVKRRR